jgi:hypothetical protein
MTWRDDVSFCALGFYSHTVFLELYVFLELLFFCFFFLYSLSMRRFSGHHSTLMLILHVSTCFLPSLLASCGLVMMVFEALYVMCYFVWVLQ